jgi:hypothetical protein
MPEVLVGHRRVFDDLARDLPRVTLLLGPEGTGKWVLAHVLADRVGYPQRDTYWSKGPLRAEHVRAALTFCRTAALGPLGKLVMLCLDNAQEGSQTALLKILEEPPDGVKFIITAGHPPLPTIVSRSFVSRCGLLSVDEVQQVLLLLGHTLPDACSAALLAGGRVSMAMHIAGVAEDALASVRAVLRAVSDGQAGRLADIMNFREWQEHQHILLARWASEASSGRWVVFSAKDAPELGRANARYALAMLAALSAARPYLADRAVMEQLAARDRR